MNKVILEKIIKDRPDLEVVMETGELIAVKEVYPHTMSYAGVAAGLSLNPEKINLIVPVSWFVKKELLTVYKVKEEKK